MMGDAGPRPPVARSARARRAGRTAPAPRSRAALIDDAASWDLVDLEPLADPSRMRANLVQRLAPAGLHGRELASAGGATASRSRSRPPTPPTASGVVTTYGDDLARAAQGHDARCAGCRASSGPSATSPRRSPTTKPSALLEEVALELGKQGRVRLARLDDAAGEAVAAALVVDDGDRAVVLAMAVDPQVAARARRACSTPRRSPRARAAASRSTSSPAPSSTRCRTLPTSKQPALAVRIWGHSTTASVGRTYAAASRRRARRARETPAVAAAQARAAWTKIRSAAASVAQYDRYCLYRGQLWTRGIEPPPGLELARVHRGRLRQARRGRRAELIEQLAARRDDRAQVLAPRRSRRARDASAFAPPASRGPRAARSRSPSSAARCAWQVRRLHPQRVRRAGRARPRASRR